MTMRRKTIRKQPTTLQMIQRFICSVLTAYFVQGAGKGVGFLFPITSRNKELSVFKEAYPCERELFHRFS